MRFSIFPHLPVRGVRAAVLPSLVFLAAAGFGLPGDATAQDAASFDAVVSPDRIGLIEGGADLIERESDVMPASHPDPDSPDVDFLFGRPNLSITLRGGMFLNRSSSDVYDEAFRQLTLEADDFRGGSGGAEVGVWIGDRLEAVVGGDWSRVTRHSESRDWVEENGDPIEQSTRLRHGPALAVGAKAYLFPRGESISRFAWTPTAFNAFVGGGVGLTWFEFEQWGDFVDEVEETIFRADFRSEGYAPSPYVSGGAEYSLSNRTSLTTEARYIWANSNLGRDFVGFEPIDLSGLRITAGLAFRI